MLIGKVFKHGSTQGVYEDVHAKVVCKQLLRLLGKLQELMDLRTECSVPYKTDPLV